MFAVIDVFDALTSDRPYRAAWSEEDALAWIREEAGRHYDPAVVAEFLRQRGEPGGSRRPRRTAIAGRPGPILQLLRSGSTGRGVTGVADDGAIYDSAGEAYACRVSPAGHWLTTVSAG